MMAASTKQLLYEVPVASTSFLKEAYWDGSRGGAIRFVYERDGQAVDARIEFQRVAAVRKLAEPYCSVWQIEECYDTLVEVQPSVWASETLLRVAANASPTINRELHHYMIYLDSVGCFEVLAKGWTFVESAARSEEGIESCQ